MQQYPLKSQPPLGNKKSKYRPYRIFWKSQTPLRIGGRNYAFSQLQYFDSVYKTDSKNTLTESNPQYLSRNPMNHFLLHLGLESNYQGIILMYHSLGKCYYKILWVDTYQKFDFAEGFGTTIPFHQLFSIKNDQNLGENIMF